MSFVSGIDIKKKSGVATLSRF